MKNIQKALSTAIVMTMAQAANAQIQGPSTGSTPYVLPLLPGTETISILTVDNTGATADDTVPNLIGGAPYGMAGIPDGMGAFDNGDGTFTLVANHELGNTVGVIRDHGAKGAYVSKWIINKNNLAVTGGTDLMKQVFGWNTATQSVGTPVTIALNRFCSADLPEVSAFYNSTTGLGSQERIFIHGEEGGSTGWQMASVITGPDAGKSYLLGKFNLTTNGSGLSGLGAWENALACPFAQDKTIVIGNNDGGTGIMSNSVAVYVGTKQSTGTGTEVDKAGLTNGTLKFVVAAGSTVEIANTTTRATNITNGTAFSLSGTASTTFSRPEDGAWNPLNPTQYYFVTTDQLDTVADGLGSQIGRTRLWRLTFSDLTNPNAGGVIDLLIDGQTVAGQKVVMFDNMTVNKATGRIILQEDVGGAAHNGKIWEYDPATFTGTTNSGALVMIAKHDAARFGDRVNPTTTAATAPFNNDEEASGIIDITGIMSGSALHKGNPGEAWYVSSDQAHYSTGTTTAQVEGGQFFVIHQLGVQLTRSGYVRDRRTGFYAQQLTLKNSSAFTVPGPFNVALDSLTFGVTLANSTGNTVNSAPLGNPYFLLPSSDAGIAAGATLPATLQFSDPSNTAINYTPRMLNGPTAP
ncbi:MAG: hypothetical protein ABIS50_02985 [Luteolibacter sp.]|uniref:hypothetical protein n=1 Tax=Luteolibacter sp. TaxID=1962973 RepID=UPI0032649199